VARYTYQLARAAFHPGGLSVNTFAAACDAILRGHLLKAREEHPVPHDGGIGASRPSMGFHGLAHATGFIVPNIPTRWSRMLA
jgi:hypothetical protein